MKTERKEKKPPKPAPIYRKPIAEKAFAKHFLGGLEQEKDRALLSSSFERVDGRYTLKEGLDRQTLVRLNVLAKAIKGNRGFLKTGPAVLALLLTAGLAVFVLFFMNPVLERSAERGLEAAFGGRSDVSRFRLNLARLSVSMAAVTVADREEPMKNLFETGRIELRLNPAALFRGRVYIEEASAASIALGTPRKTSGALDGAAAAPAPAAPPAGPSLAAVSSLVDLENFDGRALLEREKDKLRAAAAYAEAEAAYGAAADRWEARVQESKNAVAELGTLSKSVVALRTKDFRTVEDAQTALEKAKQVADVAATTAREAADVAAALKADAAAAADLARGARAALADDLAYLKSLVDPRSGVARGILEPVVWGVLDDKVDRYAYYGRRGLEAAEKLKATAGATEKREARKERAAAGRGRDVVFPSTSYPRFRLGLLASSFAAGDQDWKIELREVSSEPDLVPSPTTLRVAMERGGVRAGADVVADFRSGSAEAFSVNLQGSRLPLDLGSALSVIGLGGFTGRADATVDLRGGKTGDLAASAEVAVAEGAATAPAGAFGRAMAEALASVDAVVLDIDYSKKKGEDADFSVESNLDSLVAEAVGDLAKAYAGKATAAVERALRDYVEAELAGKLSTERIDSLVALAEGDAAAAASVKKAVDAKKAELEAQAQAIVNQGKQAAEAAAAKAKQEADAAAQAAAAAAQKAADDAKKKAAAEAAEALKKIEKPKIKF